MNPQNEIKHLKNFNNSLAVKVDECLQEISTLRTQLKSVEAERDEAKRLLVETLKFSHFGMPGVFPKPDWFARRDTFLNPKPQDVK